MKVVRNTLARRAIEGTEYECMTESLVGPTLIAFSKEHPGAAARIFKKFAKENEAFEVKVGAFAGDVVSVDMLATLPTFDEGIAKLMSVMKEASAGKLVRTLAALRDQKEQEAA
jgi:large subunit ribosomal protein L10